MQRNKLRQFPAKQKGLALLMLMIVIMLGFGSYVLSGLSIHEVKIDQQKKTQQALKKAKQALLAYAMNYPDTNAGQGNLTQGPGNFPCPDDDLDGDSDTPGTVLPGCNSAGAGTMGRFPWAELGMDELRDGDGEFLWYAISSNFTNFSNGNINTSTTGEITIRNTDGTVQFDGTGINGVVAVIISPGKALLRDDGLAQSRSTVAEIDDPQNYLDIAFGEDNAAYVNSNADGFITAPVRNAANDIIVNDQFVVITYQEVMELVHARVGEEISNVINAYFLACADYPEAAAFDPAGVGPFDSVALSQEGVLPVGIAQPIGWNAGCAIGISFPAWVANEAWHLHTYYHYSYTKVPPANCVQGAALLPFVTCLTVNNTVAPTNNKSALIVFAGRALAGQDRAAPLGMADYFEGENSTTGDFIYDDSEVEDYIRIIAP